MLDLLALTEQYDVRAPRYTSYPTAADFHDGVGIRELAAAIGRSNGDAVPAPLGLYLHLPFCHSLCFYCACNRVITRNAERAKHYRELIPAVIDALREAGVGAPVVVGGIIPEQDAAELRRAGVAAVYTPKDFDISTIVSEIVDLVGASANANANGNGPAPAK